MWRQLCNKLDIYVTPHVERRFIGAKQCYGIVCGNSIPADDVIAAIPFWFCPSPNIARASPWGKTLCRALSPHYSHQSDGVSVDLTLDSTLTMSFTALAMTVENPLRSYLNYISCGSQEVKMFESSMTSEEFGHLCQVQEASANLVTCVHRDLQDCGIDVDLATLTRADYVCASRCMDIPFSEKVLCGPAMVPFLDLVNHDDCGTNIWVSMVSAHTLPQTVQHAAKCPFYVVVRAAAEVAPGDELTFSYVDATEDPTLFNNKVYWAARFGFLRSNSPQ